MFPNRVPMERNALSPEPMVYSFIYMSRVPLPRHGGQHTVTSNGALRGWKADIQWGAALFPQGTVYDTALTTPVPCSLQHDTFQLGLSRPEPR